ncbi:Dicarboxylate transport [Roseimaritima multifibrata]|uniref:Dicarboxylate transport n=1 Tax=Roseimaritima multifibrata TaxID=1930274 RepID=A0A517MP50_9BACT|nr:hypothetical protein [Roseimaritima multifibrata]QDS96663.1 Dicarboxylate transport [Roseimaritima multifibrata]
MFHVFANKKTRYGSLLLAVLLLGLLLRNPLARFTAIKIGSSFLETELKIEAVDIGWMSVSVSGIELLEPRLAETQQAHIDKVAVELTPWTGIRKGVWASHLVIDQPTLHVRFDADGKLISQFPSGGESEPNPDPLQIPIGSLAIRDAKLVIHQTGKPSFEIADVAVTGHFTDQIEFRCLVPKLLKGSIEFHSQLSADTFAGTSRLDVHKISLDSKNLAQMPLVPSAVEQEQITGNADLTLQIKHPANTFDPLKHLKHSLQLRGVLQDLHSESVGTLADQIVLTASCDQGVSRISVVGNPLEGNLNLEASGDLNQHPLAAHFKANLDDHRLEPLRALIPDLPPFTAAANLAATGTADWDNQRLRFQLDSTTTASDLTAENIPIGDVIHHLTAEGSWSPSAQPPLSGSVSGRVTTSGIQLADVGQRYNLQSPSTMGQVRVEANYSASLDRLPAPDSIQATAKVHTVGLTIDDFQIDDTTAELQVKDGQVALQTTGGTVRDADHQPVLQWLTTGSTQLVRSSPLQVQSVFQFTPTQTFGKQLQLPSTDSSGSFTATAQAGCKIKDMADPKRWLAATTIQSNNLILAGERINDFKARCDLRDGQITLPEMLVIWRESEFRISATGNLDKQLHLQGKLNASPIRLTDVARLAERFSNAPLLADGIATIEGGFQLQSAPLQFTAGGTAFLQEAHYAHTRIGNAKLDWNADLEKFSLTSSSADFLGGRYRMTATAKELDWTQTILEGEFNDVSVPRLIGLGKQPIASTGKLDGGLQITSLSSLNALTGSAWVRSRGLSVQQAPIDIGETTLEISQGALTAKSNGSILHGTYHAQGGGDLPTVVTFLQDADPKFEKLPITGRAKLTGVNIDTLLKLAGQNSQKIPLRGSLETECIRDPSTIAAGLYCTASGSVENLRWKHARLSDRITGTLRLHSDRIELQSVDGQLADGRLSGTAEFALSAIPTGRFEFAAQRVNLRRLLQPLTGQDISGSGSMRLSGRAAGVLSGKLDLTADNIVASGVLAREARLPIDWSFSPRSGLARWQCRSGVIDTGGGKIRIASSGDGSRHMNTTTTIRLQKIDTSKLLRGKSLGAGVLDGEVFVQAKRARSIEQLVGNFDISISQAKSLEMPVLNQLPSSISLSPMAMKDDGNGYVYGRFSNGMVHIGQLAISQSNVQVLLDGNASMTGKLDLDVTVSTQQTGPADSLLSLADSPLMLAAPAPVALVAKANDLLKDRVIHAHVGGIAARPTIRLQPGKQLSQSAVQFFLKNSLGSAVADLAERQSQPQRKR